MHYGKGRLVLALAILLASLGWAQPSQAALFQNMSIAGLKVAVWLPDQPPQYRMPVIIFSHGYKGCNTQSKHLMEGLADAGYAVFAPNHKDAACKRLFKYMLRRAVPFKDSYSWNDRVYADRQQDIRALLDALQANRDYAEELDWQRIGLVGHSLGGYTVLGMAGAWPAWKDNRIGAVLALSPYVAPFVAQQTLRNVTVPVMYQGGTHDLDITPTLNKPSGAYDITPAGRKIYVELYGAGHFAWTNMTNTYTGTINDYDVAFFDYYLRGRPFPPEMLQKHAQVSRIWTSL